MILAGKSKRKIYNFKRNLNILLPVETVLSGCLVDFSRIRTKENLVEAFAQNDSLFVVLERHW